MKNSKLQFKIQNFTFLVIIFSFLLSFFNLSQAQAAKLFFNSKTQEVGINQQFQIDLTLDAEGEDINAAEGAISFPAEMLELKEIRDGNSVISFWIEKPVLKESGKIKFSGVIPGGFQGVLGPYWQGYKPGKVFSLIFTAKKEGIGAIEIRDAKVLLNDGAGTPAGVKISNFAYSAEAASAAKTGQFSIKDIDPPELFTPEVTSDPNIFDGQWFLVFAAQDKGSGVANYAVHESRQIKSQIATKDWNAAESPYLLKDQKLRSYIYVKAVDKAGNERFIVVSPKFAPWYKKPIVDIIVGLILLIVLLLTVRWLWRWLYTKKHEY